MGPMRFIACDVTSLALRALAARFRIPDIARALLAGRSRIAHTSPLDQGDGGEAWSRSKPQALLRRAKSTATAALKRKTRDEIRQKVCSPIPVPEN